MSLTKCNNCGIIFKGKGKKMKYCTYKCFTDSRIGNFIPWNKDKAIIKESLCLQCKKLFKFKPCFNRKYCSTRCFGIANRGNKTAYVDGRRKKNEYISILNPKHPSADNMGYVSEHRLVMEKRLGRYLNKEEVVHHIDYNPVNNQIDNLHLFKDVSEHTKYHHFLRKCVKEILCQFDKPAY